MIYCLATLTHGRFNVASILYICNKFLTVVICSYCDIHFDQCLKIHIKSTLTLCCQLNLKTAKRVNTFYRHCIYTNTPLVNTPDMI